MRILTIRIFPPNGCTNAPIYRTQNNTMPFDVFFDGPAGYRNKFDFYSCGCSPKLVKALQHYLTTHASTLSEIHVCLYLFNNSLLHQQFIVLSQQGIQVNVYTIPIEGYDATNAKDILDVETRGVVTNSTKHTLAKEIFSGHYRKQYTGYNLYFFPHLYLRSSKVKKFSRGNMPYSLHAKSFLFKHDNGRYDMAITSSNFAVRDLVKEENLLFIYDEPTFQQAAINFFTALRKMAIPISEFDFTTSHCDFVVTPVQHSLQANGGFIAPFYYNASLQVEDYLTALITAAKKRVIIVGQHVCPVNYQINVQYHTGFTTATNNRIGLACLLLQKATEGLAITILSQTFTDGSNVENNTFRRPANTGSFIQFFKQLQGVPNIQYQVNENCHSKYIIIDDAVFVSTFNYTPTQFIYLDSVAINNFVHNPGKTYKGIYAEVGQFVVIEDKAVVDKYLANYMDIKSNKETISVQ